MEENFGATPPPPAAPMTDRPGPASDTSKLLAALGYLFGIVAVVALLIDPYKEEKFVKFHGENSDYDTGFKDGKWFCSCSFFHSWGLCSHTMALEKILGQMLPPEAMTTQGDTIR